MGGQNTVDYVTKKRAETEETIRLFRELFGRVAPGQPFDLSIGRPTFTDMGLRGYHIDNWAGGVAIARPLGVTDIGLITLNDEVHIHGQGDFFVVGGPNTTNEAAIALQFEGAQNERRRTASPILPLRWYPEWVGHGRDSLDSEITLMAYEYEDGGVRARPAWPIVDMDTETNKIRRLLTLDTDSETVTVTSASNDQMDIIGKRFPVPSDNYLIVTRLPNFLHPRFDQIIDGHDRTSWPHLLVFEGTHGIGTRSVELLTQSDGLVALQQAAADSASGSMRIDKFGE